MVSYARVMLPIVDGGKLESSATIQSLNEALHDCGFLYLKNHGVSEKLQRELLELSKKFFSEDLRFKMQIDMKKGGLAWRGYFPVGGELTSGKPDHKEGLYFGRELDRNNPAVIQKIPLHGMNLWPSGASYSRFKNVVLDYMAQLNDLGQNLMAAIGEGIGLPRNYFLKRFTSEPTTLFRIFNYPQAQASVQDQWGVREHTDMGFLTILLQDQNTGLQVKTRSQSWISAPPIDGTFVVNIGDMLELWTHGLYKATPHRVRNEAKGDRLSFPFFFDPNWNTTLEPIDLQLISKEKRNWLESTKTEGLSPEVKKRWDGLNLKALSNSITYGDFVWAKVKNVFPDLAGSST